MNAVVSKPIKVGIRGCCGSQGAELGKLIRKQSGMELSLGIAVPDKTFSRAIRFGGDFLPKTVLVDGIAAPNGFESVQGKDLNKYCDILVDATAFATPAHIQYSEFSGKIITFEAQDKEANLIVPPLGAASAQESIFRISDCVGSALGSMLSPFLKEGISRIFASVVKNTEGKINGTLPPDKANAVSRMPQHVRRVCADMEAVLGAKTAFNLHIHFHPGIGEYSGELDITMKDRFASQRIQELLSEAPHTLVVKAEELDSTYDSMMIRKLRIAQPIIACVITSNKPSNTFSINFTIGSESIGPVHAIDAIRYLGTGLELSECAKITDANLGWET